MNVLSALSLLATAVYGALAVAALRRDRHAPVNRVFSMLCAALAIWALGFAFMYSASTREACWAWDRVASLGWAVFPALALHTSLHLSGQRRWTDRAWILWLIYLPALVIFIRYQLARLGFDVDYTRLPQGWAPNVDAVIAWFWLFEAYVGVCMGTAIANLWWWSRTARLARERRQAQVILASGTLAFIVAFGADVVVDALMGPRPPMAPVLILIFAAGTAYAMSRHQMLVLTPATASARILESVRDLLLLVSPEGRITDANPPALEALGYARHELVGADLAVVVGSPEAARKLLAASRNRVAGTFPLEQAWQHREGRTLPVGVWGLPVDDPEGDWIGTVLVGRDLSEQRATGEGSGGPGGIEAMALLSAGMAHDFNNLMTVVLGNLDLARREPPGSPHVADRLADASRAAEQAHELSQRLLSFHRGESAARADLDLAPLIADTAHVALRGSNVELVLRIAPDLRHVRANAGQMAQVVHNLVLNARQAMASGGTLTITADNRDAPPEGTDAPASGATRWVEVTVHDRGPGLPEGWESRIFDPFFTTKPGGSGLGLASSLSLVRRHGGTILAGSVAGDGAVFRVYLPAA